MPSQSNTAASRGFSLIELLVVIAIIALVIAIIVPALAGARTAAKKASTATLISNVTKAAEQFSQDHSGGLPGYYAPSDMAKRQNNPTQSSGGFSAMENVLLDLIGRDAILGESGLVGGNGGGGGGSGTLEVGPGRTGKGDPRNVEVDPGLLGTGSGVYLTLGADNLYAASGQVGSSAHKQFPDVVDAFGNPLLAWIEDPMGPREPATAADFATDVSMPDRARYYWMSNAAWLTSTSMGKGGQNQTFRTDNGKVKGSLLGDAASADIALTAVLGNPNFASPTNHTAANVLPSASRGAFIVHSAGADGVFFGVEDDGAKGLGITDPNDFEYALNFYKPDGQRLTDSKGIVTTIDLTQSFDDLMATAGN